jgi:ribosomal protein S18 acetylase RimI-like enzyme
VESASSSKRRCTGLDPRFRGDDANRGFAGTMIEIRQVSVDNSGLLGHLAKDVFDEPIDPARLARYVAAPGHLMLVALEGELVVGQVMAVIHYHPDKPTELYIDELGVAPAWQRRGIGRRLMEAMLALGRARGCEEVWVGTEPDNDAARALYGQFAEAAPFLMYLWDA